MGLRELDFDKRFTATGIFKSKFILANDVSVLEKFVGIAVSLLILYSVYILVIRRPKAFLKGLAALNLRSYVVFLALAIAVISTKSAKVEGTERADPAAIMVSTTPPELSPE